MTALRNVGAAAPGPVTPTSDEAPADRTAQGFKETADSLDCAAATRVAQLPQRDLVWRAVVGVIMAAAALAFLVTVGQP